MSTATTLGIMPLEEGRDKYEPYDFSSHHIGKTRASLVLRPIVHTPNSFRCATGGCRIAEFIIRRTDDASIIGEFDEARRNVFKQVAESICGPNRFKFFKYRPQSYPNWISAFTNLPSDNENCPPQASMNRNTARMNEEEIGCGKSE